MLMHPMPDHPLLKAPDGQFIEIDGESLFLGRDCHLAVFIPSLANKVVSNRHCVVRREAPDRWMLEDLGSTNGTWIRSTRLNGKTLLHTGDSFSLGKGGPLFECFRAFGGLGPNATLEEKPGARVAPPSADKTVIDPDLAGRTILASGGPPREPAGATALASRPGPAREGTLEKPYKTGRMPSIKLRHERTGQEFIAEGYTVVLGRDPAAQVVIRTDEERHVSGRHAEIQFRSDGTVVLRDLGSKNGTWLNDKRLKDEGLRLGVGDRILLGAAATMLLVKRLDGGA